MTWKDKLEIGLKEDAPYRKDNLPENQIRGPEIPRGEGRSPEIPLARSDRNIIKRTRDVKHAKDAGMRKKTRPSLALARQHAARRSGR
jgi:hypothetical protein